MEVRRVKSTPRIEFKESKDKDSGNFELEESIKQKKER